jgi:hypothetical protein
MARFKRPGQLLAASFVFSALTSTAPTQEIKEIKFEVRKIKTLPRSPGMDER